LHLAAKALNASDPRRSCSLREAPPARPTADFSVTALETIEDARQRLGFLPKFTVYYRQGDDQTPRGESGFDDDGALCVWLDYRDAARRATTDRHA
jgi:hypothetical protein